MTLFLRVRLGRFIAVLTVLSLPVALAACQSPVSATGTTNARNAENSENAANSGNASGAAGADTQTSADGSSGTAQGAASSDGVPEGLTSFYDQDLTWSDCADGGAGYQCASATVPLNYDDPSGDTLSIALKRLPASDGTAELGSLFLNPGGPGASGTSMITTAATLYTPEMLASYDLIGFDPRGVGGSTHLTCWSPDDLEQMIDANNATTPGEKTGEEDDQEQGADGAASDDPEETEEPEEAASPSPTGEAAAPPKIDDIFWTSTVSRGSTDATACRTHSEVPGLIDHMGKSDTARDLDVLRSAVGDKQLNYLGYSYGTAIGAAYAELFPSSVGRVALDSAQDPTLTRSETADAQFAYRESRLRAYLGSCLDQGDCPVTGTVDEAVSQLTAFFKSLDGKPLTVTQDGRTSQMDSSTAFTHAQNLWLTRPEYWPALTRALSAAMTRHDGTELARVGALVPGTGQITKPTTQEQALFTMVYTAAICADSPDVDNQDAWNAEASKAYTDYPLMSAMGSLPAGTDAYCHGWGVTSSSAPAEVHASGSAPILVVGVTEDSQTPYTWAQSLATQLDAGHLLTVEGYRHGASMSNTCAISRVSDYLVNGALPDEGDAGNVTCPIDPLPADAAEALSQ